MPKTAEYTTMIVNADDFGETEAITQGIFDCIQAGVVTSTTIMANMPGTNLAIRLAKVAKASFGVHLNICEGYPLTSCPSLVMRDGKFYPKQKQALRILSGRVDRKELQEELTAQVGFIRTAGIAVSHFDSHKQLHHLPVFSDAVIELAKRTGLERIRCANEPRKLIRSTLSRGHIAGLLRRKMANRLRVKIEAANLRCPDAAFDIQSLMKLNSKALRTLAATSNVIELFCHPGNAQADLEKPGSCKRFLEQQFLMSPRFRTLLHEANIQLVNYWAL
jgi:predicted glycoside hydrolase/deacetylase ChbG (UPF0249 family)